MGVPATQEARCIIQIYIRAQFVSLARNQVFKSGQCFCVPQVFQWPVEKVCDLRFKLQEGTAPE